MSEAEIVGQMNQFWLLYLTYSHFTSTSFLLHFILRISSAVILLIVLFLATTSTGLHFRNAVLSVVAGYLIDIPTFFMFRDRGKLYVTQQTHASIEQSLRTLLNVIPEGLAIFRKSKSAQLNPRMVFANKQFKDTLNMGDGNSS